MRRFALTVVALLLLLALAPAARAGGGPETTLVVANADSPTSLEVANEYVRLRDIPSTHVLYLEDIPPQPIIDVETFRQRILRPIEAHLAAQGLANDVDTITYSVGFPYGVNFQADAREADFEIVSPISRTASLTGLTFLYRQVLAKNPAGYLGLQANGYFRRPAEMPTHDPTQTSPEARALETDAQGALRSKDWKRATEGFAKLTHLVPGNPGHWYNLACCLALLERPDEALDALEKAVEHGFRNVDHARQDVDLESLRERPAFQRLLEAMREVAPVQPSRGFAARHAWTGHDEPVENAPADSPDRFRLAVMLGWTGTYGNSVPEILACLRRAAGSDGTRPDGTVYFLVNDDVRSQTRTPFFESAASALRRMGRKARILVKGQDDQDGVLPRNRNDVLGLVAGVAHFRWGEDMPDLLPGSIAEHLTSFGAHFGTRGQTKCTEFIRHGAAGSSGTVAEPFSTPFKFPVPHVHLHYASGCSLAEAFYQSVWGPYQLLILGDPLTRPFAYFSDVAFASPDPGQSWSGTVAVQAKVTSPPGSAARSLELWVDGRLTEKALPGAPLPWDTTKVADGVHELRLVAVDAGPIRTRSYAKALVRVANGTHTLEVQAPDEVVAYGDPVRLRGTAEGVETVELLRGSQVLAMADVESDAWRLETPSPRLGIGRVVLYVRGTAGDGSRVRSAPLAVDVTGSSDRLVPRVVEDEQLLPGLLATLTDADGKEHEGIVITVGGGRGRTLGHDLAALGVPKPTKVRLEGLLRAPASGLWEIELHTRGPVRCLVGGREIVTLDGAPASGRAIVLLGLEEGWHALVLEAEGPDVGRLALRLRGPRAASPASDHLLARQPLGRERAKAPESAFLAGSETNAPHLLNGNRRGRGVDLSSEGIEVHWKRSESNLVGVVLFPVRGWNAPALPIDWIVETRSSKRGRWKPVKNLRIAFCPGPEAPGKDRVPVHRYVELSFDRVSARRLRVRPVDTSATPRLTEIEVMVRSRRRR